jgi:hypothetical protein
MAFHDSEITALQGWAGGVPAAECRPPPPVVTRSQVALRHSTCLSSVCNGELLSAAPSGPTDEGASPCLCRRPCLRRARRSPLQQTRRHHHLGASTSPGMPRLHTAHRSHSSSRHMHCSSAYRCCVYEYVTLTSDVAFGACRLLAMGAVPTLGGLLRMPASATQLNATASPAARELLRRCDCVWQSAHHTVDA